MTGGGQLQKLDNMSLLTRKGKICNLLNKSLCNKTPGIANQYAVASASGCVSKPVFMSRAIWRSFSFKDCSKSGYKVSWIGSSCSTTSVTESPSPELFAASNKRPIPRQSDLDQNPIFSIQIELSVNHHKTQNPQSTLHPIASDTIKPDNNNPHSANEPNYLLKFCKLKTLKQKFKKLEVLTDA